MVFQLADQIIAEWADEIDYSDPRRLEERLFSSFACNNAVEQDPMGSVQSPSTDHDTTQLFPQVSPVPIEDQHHSLDGISERQLTFLGHPSGENSQHHTHLPFTWQPTPEGLIHSLGQIQIASPGTPTR